MKTFLGEIAASLYDRYGDEISSLTFLFPSRRARLFFSDALAEVARRPLWQPRFTGVDELMEQIAGVRRSEPVKLIAELYKVYRRYHDEPFDTFYFWGEMLLADFDQIDKYRLDARMLFTNIGDLHRLGEHFDYLSPAQREAIARFWGHFDRQSREQQQFIRIWETLGPIYDEFRASLSAQGLAYEGMVHRLAAERLEQPQAVPLDGEARYIVAGFNALSVCEQRLFRWLQAGGRTEFYWDYDRYYVENPDHEAGLFLRSDLRDFPPGEGVVSSDDFKEIGQIVAVASPSESLECKYVHTFLQGLLDRGLTPGQETAVVLADESLLPQVLYAIPEGIGAVNITMGYPLRQTTAYSFVERLIELQRRKRLRSGGIQFYHSDVTGLLGHPYLLERHGQAAREVAQAIRRRQAVYVPADMFSLEGFAARIFLPVEGWRGLCAYLREALSTAGTVPPGEGAEGEQLQRREWFSLIIDRLVQLEATLEDSSLELTEAVFASLLRRMLQQMRVPYQGEPLAGIQIMGILETRGLDFENVLVLSCNDDVFPGTRTAAASFIPHNLRLVYGLPTPQQQEGVYAYYFYRLLQRARTVHLAYCSRSDERRSGEPSRYLYQLQYESPHKVIRRTIPLSVHLSQPQSLAVAKTDAVAVALEAYLGPNGPVLSPTSFYRYVECPLKFYLHSIAGLRVQEEISEEIDLPMFGTLLHKAMEILYTPLRGIAAPGERIARLIASPQVDEAVELALREAYFKGEPPPAEEYAGQVLVVRDTVRRYLRQAILPYDAAHPDFSVLALEEQVRTPFAFSRSTGPATVRFGGTADRIDALAEGGLRVVDYKTGERPEPFASIAALFSPQQAARSAAAFQTLLYSLVIGRMRGEEVQPALYYVRRMNAPDYSPLLQAKSSGPVVRYSACAAEFETLLGETLAALFDLSVPFAPCEDTKTCTYCDYRELCRR